LTAGMLSLFPQTWLSDNTDALARLSIQFGAGLVYPYSSMSGHVSAAPNHQNGRTTPLEFRFHTALMCLSTGFEMDLGKLSEEEASTLKSLTPLIDQVRPLIHHGDVYRLAWPQDSNWPAMLFVSKDRSRAVLFAFQLYSKVTERPLAIKLRGLDATASYKQDNGAEFHGSFLVDHGLVLRFDRADYRSRVISFTRI
jgi:alpha-galactosidase